jgi:outer membrane receptor protein involved in Fe transport
MKSPFFHKIFLFGLVLFCLTSAYAQDEEVTNFDDQLENDDVTVLDELSVETDEEAVRQAQAKKVESVSSIDATEMQNTSKTISKAINNSSGVKVRKSGGMGSDGKINIRGMEGKNIKLLVNGIPVETQGNIGVDDIPIEQIADIEVYKGYIPARFATDGAGGAINIITKKRPTNSVDAAYSFSSFNTHKASVSASHTIDSLIGGSILEVGVSGYFNHSDNDYEFSSPYMKNSEGNDTSVVRDHDRYSSYNVQTFANWMNAWFDNISLGASYGAYTKEIQGTEYRILSAEAEGYHFGANFGLSKNDFFLKDLGFNNQFSFGYDENKIIDTSHIHCRNWITCDTVGKSVGELVAMGLPKLRIVEIYDFNDALNFNYKFLNNQFIYWNTLFRFHKENPEDEFGAKVTGFNTAGYPGKTISLTTGLSLENRFWNEKIQNLIGFKFHYLKAKISSPATSALNESSMEFSAYKNYSYDESIRYQIAEPFAIKASYQHAVRLPTPDELFGDGIKITSASGLKPEEADNFNIGVALDWMQIPLITRLRVDADWFYSYYKNRIHYLTASQMAVPYYNMDPIRGWGYEGDVKVDVNEWVLLATNFTFQDLRNVNYIAQHGIPEDAIMPNIPRFFMNYLAEFHIGDLVNSGDFLKLWWNANYTAEYYYGWKVSSRQNRKIDASFSQDIGIEYSIWENKLAWSFEVDNFLDATVYDNYGESKPGRTFATKIRYSFH